MSFLGRRRELGALRSLFDRTEPVHVRLTGPRGMGKTALAARAVEDIPHVRVSCPPLPDPDIRAHAVGAVSRRIEDPDTLPADAPPPSWAELLRALRRHAARQPRPWVLVLDDAHRLTEARARVDGPLLRLLEDRDGPPLHLLLVGREPGLPGLEGRRPELHLSLGPLSFRAALPRLPGRDPVARLRAYAVFGGTPAHLRHLDPGTTVATNLRHAVLEAGAPLARTGLDLLEPGLQRPARYAAILRTLARGEAEWGTIHAGVRDLTASGQVAPYLRRLEALGLVEVRRSLDAAPDSRSRRYRIRDPFVAFWFRFLLPELDRLGSGEGRALLGEVVRPDLDAHAATVFPEVCRQFMANDVMEYLAVNAREVGSLWGDGYDLEVAGILSSGIPFYGRAPWRRPPRPTLLAHLDQQIRETRYGFGREVRLRAVFSPHGFPRTLERRVASRRDGILVGPRQLAGLG
jgi:hypothetical protein